MFVQYNGIDLEVERVVQWSDRNIMSEDGSERLMRHVSLAVQCVVNPAATTVPGLNALSAPQIIAALKQRLLALRGSLIVTIGGREVVRSPARAVKAGTPRQADIDGASVHYCDARGGPVPLYCDVTSIHGLKTMLVTFAIETWLVESVNPGGEAEQSALIAHRWTTTNSLDEHYYNTRTISGSAVFRADFLTDVDPQTGGSRQLVKPGDYLAELNHPLPTNYRRENVQTSISSNGLTLNYTIRDVEQQSTIDEDRPVSKVEGTYASGVHQPSVINLPSTWTRISVTCQGRRGATKEEMIRSCIKAARTFDTQAQLQRRTYWQSSLTVDMSRIRATLHLGYSVQGMQGFFVDQGMRLVGWARPRGIEANRDFPDNLEGDLGNAIHTPTDGQQPLFGMIGDIQGFGLGGGQRNLVTQQWNDGAIVPSLVPIADKAEESQTTEAEDARAARGEVARRTE